MSLLLIRVFLRYGPCKSLRHKMFEVVNYKNNLSENKTNVRMSAEMRSLLWSSE